MQPLHITLKRQRKRRLEEGHPWVYSSEIERLDAGITPGSVVDIVNHQGVFLARGYANPASQIVARVLSYDVDPIDEHFFTRRLRDAWQYRQRFLAQADFCRAVYGEADFLPGLIVDKYGDVLVVQILSFGMEALKPLLLPALLTVFQPTGIYLRNDVPVREREGLQQETGVWYGEVPREIEIEENGLHFVVDIMEGQKTGYFFDQRDNRVAIAPLMRGRVRSDDHTQAVTEVSEGADVLECFCHTGSFTVHALQYGARHVTAVDISDTAVAMAKRNAARNQFTVGPRLQFEVANAFDYLREAGQQRRSYDVVLLDPPAFAKSKGALPGAVRGYKEINLRALKLIRDGGFLVTASCSSHMYPELFRDTILAAAVDAHKVLRLVHWSGAGKDHPEIAGVEEGHYLKFAIYEVHSRG